MKGEYTLFGSLIMNQDKAPKPEGYKPRNFLMPERDRCLAHRYYYYAQIQKMRYDLIMQQLGVEFFLTEHRLAAVLSDNRKMLEEIIAQAPDHKALSQLYPHLIWQAKKN